MTKKDKFKRFAKITKDKISELSQNKVKNKQLLKDWRRFARKFDYWDSVELLIESSETNDNPWKQLKTIYSKQFWNEWFPIVKKINAKRYVVYCLKWTKTDHYYIGRADNLSQRLALHRQAAKTDYYRHRITKELSWNKVEILEYPRTKQDLLRAEQYYLDNHYHKKLCLNWSTDAYGGVGRYGANGRYGRYGVHYQSWKNILLDCFRAIEGSYEYYNQEKPKCEQPKWRWTQLTKFKAERSPVNQIKVFNDLMLEKALEMYVKTYCNWWVKLKRRFKNWRKPKISIYYRIRLERTKER